MMRSEEELREQMETLLQIDATKPPAGVSASVYIGNKIGAVKALLWCLGEQEDRWYVPAKPGALIPESERVM